MLAFWQWLSIPDTDGCWLCGERILNWEEFAVACWIFFMIVSGSYADDCPPEGSAKSPAVQELNRLKNRTGFPSADQVEVIVGYVRKVHQSGPESCNCYSATERDWHVEIETTEGMRLVEITPRVSLGVPSVGQRVQVFGWRMFDWMHGVVEIHPVTSIMVIP